MAWPQAAPARHEVVLDDALGAGHHDAGDLVRRRRLRHPRRREIEVEVDRSCQPDGAEHVGQDVGDHRGLRDDRACRQDAWACRTPCRTRGNAMRTPAHGSRPNGYVTFGVRRHGGGAHHKETTSMTPALTCLTTDATATHVRSGSLADRLLQGRPRPDGVRASTFRQPVAHGGCGRRPRRRGDRAPRRQRLSARSTSWRRCLPPAARSWA